MVMLSRLEVKVPWPYTRTSTTCMGKLKLPGFIWNNIRQCAHFISGLSCVNPDVGVFMNILLALFTSDRQTNLFSIIWIKQMLLLYDEIKDVDKAIRYKLSN